MARIWSSGAASSRRATSRERFRQVLEVVEDEQRRPLREGDSQRVELPARHVAEVEGSGDGGQDERRVGER